MAPHSSALVALERDRLRCVCLLVVFFAAPAAGVVLASKSPALTAAGATLQTAQAEGQRLGWQLALLAAVEGRRSSRAHDRAQDRVSQRSRVAVVTGLVALGCGAAIAGVIHLGGPTEVADRVQDGFVEEPPPTAGGLDRRLLSVSGNGRADYFRVPPGWSSASPCSARAPLVRPELAAGAPGTNEARDAHNLYLETLAELGPVGLALLLIALAAPFVALPRIRSRAWSSAAAAAYIAFLVHAAMTGTGRSHFSCLSRSRVPPRFSLPCRPLLVPSPHDGAASGSSAQCAVSQRHWSSTSATEPPPPRSTPLAADNAPAALVDARRARTWMPWSYEPSQLVGEAFLLTGVDDHERAWPRRAVELDPGQWSVWFDLALASRGAERR